MATTRARKVVIWVGAVVGFAAIVAGVLIGVQVHRKHRPVALHGAVMKQNADPRDQSPIADVRVSAAGGLSVADGKSDFSGSFILRLRPGSKLGQGITLTFRHPDYQPLDLKDAVSDKLYVVRMIPLHGEAEAALNATAVMIGNVLVRYSTETTTTENIGTGVKTFQVVNRGNVPCNKQPPCSPDGKWKAQVGSASLDAGAGNVFRNARVTCIAGPCPFTRIDDDEFSPEGRNIAVSVRGWSDTTTFLLQAEVFRTQVGDIIRMSYPVISGRAMNFTLPATAEGPSIEAELNGSSIVFPLRPDPTLSWAVCNVRVERNQAKDYRCELKAGYQFR